MIPWPAGRAVGAARVPLVASALALTVGVVIALLLGQRVMRQNALTLAVAGVAPESGRPPAPGIGGNR